MGIIILPFLLGSLIIGIIALVKSIKLLSSKSIALKKVIIFLVLFALPYITVFAQVNPPSNGAGLVTFYQNCPVYKDVNGQVIGHLFSHYNSEFVLKLNNGDSIVVKDWLEMSATDSYMELLFFEKRDGFVKIAKSSNKGKGVWLRETNSKDSSITAIPWQTMILDTIHRPDEFFFISKRDSIQLFKSVAPNSSFETVFNHGNWYLKLTGNTKGNWIEVIAIEKKFEPCYEYYSDEEDEKQQDLRTIRGYIQCLDKSGLPVIWFLICES